MDAPTATDLRFALRRYLASRPSAAMQFSEIAHAMQRKGFDATRAEILDELTYWLRLPEPHVSLVPVPHSSEDAWQITSVGRLADERGE